MASWIGLRKNHGKSKPETMDFPMKYSECSKSYITLDG